MLPFLSIILFINSHKFYYYALNFPFIYACYFSDYADDKIINVLFSTGHSYAYLLYRLIQNNKSGKQ